MWVIVFLFFFTIYIQISIIPNNIMFFLSFLYEVILTLHVMGQKVMNMFLIDVFFVKYLMHKVPKCPIKALQ